MSLIPKVYLNSVVAIGIDNLNGQNQEKIWIATGFLVKLIEPNNSTVSTVYLITNKHVFEMQKMVYIRFNSIMGEFVRDYPIPLVDKWGHKLYTEHPKADIDIVAMQINPELLVNDNAIWNAFDLDTNSLSLRAMSASGVDEGAIVYSLGFPMNLVDAYKTPVCRYGCIARIADAFLKPDSASFYLVDVHSFPGNSGGPIINKPELVNLNGTNCNPAANLIGILCANIPYKDVLVSQQTQQVRMIQSENSGLTIVHPVDRIRETVLLEWNRQRSNSKLIESQPDKDNQP